DLGGVLGVPRQRGSIKYWPLDTDPAIIPPGIRPHSGHAAEADAHTASHRCLQRQMAGNVPALGKLRQRLHHRLRTAPDEMLRSLLLLHELSYKSLEAQRTVIRGQMHLRAGRAKVVDTGCQVRGAHPVIKRDTFGFPSCWHPCIPAPAE